MKINRMELQERLTGVANPPVTDREGNVLPPANPVKVKVVLDKTASVKNIYHSDQPNGRGNLVVVTLNPNKYRSQATLELALRWVEGVLCEIGA